MKNILPILFTIILVNSCNTKEYLDITPAEELSQNNIISASSQALSSKYSVTPQMILKYLRTFKKNKSVEQIIPLDKNGTILGYYILYQNNNGWEIIGADTRMSPVLLYSDSGFFDFSFDNEPAIEALKSSLEESINNVKHSINQNEIWSFLAPSMQYNASNNIDRTNGKRGIGSGMWIAVDTTLETVTTTVPHLIHTEWNQSEPWNHYTKMINGSHAKVGCSPVAVGQIMYKFLSNTSVVSLPTSAQVQPDGSVTFGDFSTSAWGAMAKKHIIGQNIDSCYKSAIFLSWLGNEMGTSYGLDSSDTDISDINAMLSRYFTFAESTQIEASSSIHKKRSFKDIIYSCLINNSAPVFVSLRINDSIYHSCIIDALTKIEERIIVNYVFDPDHYVTEQEINQYPSWMFEPPVVSGDKDPFEMEKVFSVIERSFIKFNWGWNTSDDQTNFLLYEMYSSNIDGTMYSNEYFNFNWTAGGYSFKKVQTLYHSFSMSNN